MRVCGGGGGGLLYLELMPIIQMTFGSEQVEA